MRLRAKAAAHRGDLHAHLAELQAERLRQFAAHAGGELRGDPHRQSVGAPVGDDGVRLHAAMGLGLGAIFALDHDLGLGEALVDVATAARGFRSADVADRLQVRGDRNFRHRQRWLLAGLIDQRCIRPSRRIEIDDERQRRVIDADQSHRRFGRRLCRCRDRCDRSADIAQLGVVRRNHQYGADAGLSRGGAGVDRLYTRVRQRRAQDARMQHARQLDVHGEAHRAGDLGSAIAARHRLADHLKRAVDRERRRFVVRHLTFDFA